MDTCDVLIIGGGPAGSSCAWKLRQAGLDVVVMDRAAFPRDKVCAGWITPQVLAAVGVDVDEYRRERTCQPITGFRTGLLGGGREIETTYDHPVSFGIRRCEFDHYLLQRSTARLKLGLPIISIRKEQARWIVNDAVAAPMLVGAGGHFCPVARSLNPVNDINGVAAHAPVVAAQEAEFKIDPREAASLTSVPDTPELYFCRDFKGYGWCFRKEDYLNIGFGRVDGHALPQASAGFADFLTARRKIPRDRSWRWRGHAYLLAEPPRRRVVDAGVLLVGDAAGLAYAPSGEGIRPAIESGLLAAATIVEAGGDYTRERIEPYEDTLRERFGLRPGPRPLSEAVVSGLAAALLPALFNVPWFVRHLLLDRWFLRAHDRPLAPG
jgi:flavin-dependent dehydrogenase